MSSRQRAAIVCGMGVILGLTLASLVRSDVFAVPTSDDVVIGSLVLKTGEVAKFRAREGTMVTVSGNGEFFGFVPQVQDKPTKLINVIPFKITDLGDDRQRADEILGESKVFQAGIPKEIKSDSFAIKIQFSDIVTGRFINPAADDPGSMTPKELNVLYGKSSGDFCCLTCGGVTVCANGVSMSCGSCYAGGGGGRMPV